MEENEYRRTLDEVRELPCVFQKAILNRRCDCALVERFNLGEREAVRCTQWTAANNCATVLDLLRENGRFALGMAHVPGPLPHAKELRLQAGGIAGLRRALDPEADPDDTPPDIHGVISRAQEAYGTLQAVPFNQVVHGIHDFQGRRRSRRRRDP